MVLVSPSEKTSLYFAVFTFPKVFFMSLRIVHRVLHLVGFNSGVQVIKLSRTGSLGGLGVIFFPQINYFVETWLNQRPKSNENILLYLIELRTGIAWRENKDK